MEIKLARIDSRLIHGQVVTKWVRQTNANEIMIIDDALAKDPFMLSIYKMAAPADTPVTVASVEEAAADYKAGKYEGKRLFILFKDVDAAYRAHKGGFPLEKVQIGGLGSGPGKKKVYGPIYFDDQDTTQLKEMDDAGVDITLQQVPEEASLTFAKALERIK